jgi:hypothetical protein
MDRFGIVTRNWLLVLAVCLGVVSGLGSTSASANFAAQSLNFDYWTDSNIRACNRAELHYGPLSEGRWGRSLGWMTSPASCTADKVPAYLQASASVVAVNTGLTCLQGSKPWESRSDGLIIAGVPHPIPALPQPGCSGPFVTVGTAGGCIWTACRHMAASCPGSPPYACTALNLFPTVSPQHAFI